MISAAFQDPPLENINVVEIVPPATPTFLDLNLYVLGEEDPEESVHRILADDEISVLKQKAKNCHSVHFSNVDTRNIQLFAVSLTSDQLQGVTDPSRLTAARELTDPMEKSLAVFKIPLFGRVHVVAFNPPPISLNLYVAGVGQSQKESVEIHPYDQISVIKEKIKDRRPLSFSGVYAKDIQLFTISLLSGN
jgi:hypothetical protein